MVSGNKIEPVIIKKWRRKTFYFFLGFITFFQLSSFYLPGDPVITAARRKLNHYKNHFPRESAYIQLDKESYQPGDIIWFKGYLTSFSGLSGVSKIVYVELFSSTGYILSQLMLPVKDGSFNGQMVLPDKLMQGDYFLRAYTAWMSNFGNSLFFYKKISIASKGLPTTSKTISTVKDISVQFYPEGGNLVEGLTSLVAFKAANQDGSPIKVSGKIINTFGDAVASISSGADGLGSFNVHISPGIAYTAIVSASGIAKKIRLPEAKRNGIVLHVENHHGDKTDTVFLNVSRSIINKEKYENLILCVQANDEISVSGIRFNEAVAGNPMDTILDAPSPLLAKFSTGVLHLSVLNRAGELLAQRLVFVRNNQPYLHSMGVETLQAEVSPTEKNTVMLHIPPGFDGASLSVSVTDADRVIDPDEKGTIEDAVLIASDINAYDNSGGHFLKDAQPASLHALDLFLLTRQTALYDLEKVFKNEFPVIRYFPEQSISLKGKAFKFSNNQLQGLFKEGSCLIILKNNKDSLTRLLNAFTDSAGEFAISGLDFHDTATVFAQAGEKTGNPLHEAIVLRYEKDLFDSIRQYKFISDPFLRQYRNDSFMVRLKDSVFVESMAGLKAGMLKSVTVKGKRKSRLDSLIAKYATGVFAAPNVWASTMDFTQDAITKNLDEDVLTYLNGKVPGLNFQRSNGEWIIYWRYSNFMQGLSSIDQLKLNAPSFFLNEQLLNAEIEGYDEAVKQLSNIRMPDVAMVRVFQPGMNPMAPNNGPHGSIAIYLKDGTEIDQPVSGISFSKTVKTGYSMALNDFDSAKNILKNADYFANQSTTLYWNPLVKIDAANHIATFRFHTNNFSKRFRIIAEGIDHKGMIVRLNKIIE